MFCLFKQIVKRLFTCIYASMLICRFEALALTFEIENACDPETSVFFETQTVPIGLNVGDVTLLVLEQHQVPYLGNSRGLHWIWHSPIGLEALDVISDFEMYSYGWCFTIDGFVPEQMADQIDVMPHQHIKWFFGSSHYIKGEWLNYCEPARLKDQKGTPAICQQWRK